MDIEMMLNFASTCRSLHASMNAIVHCHILHSYLHDKLFYRLKSSGHVLIRTAPAPLIVVMYDRIRHHHPYAHPMRLALNNLLLFLPDDGSRQLIDTLSQIQHSRYRTTLMPDWATDLQRQRLRQRYRVYDTAPYHPTDHGDPALQWCV